MRRNTVVQVVMAAKTFFFVKLSPGLWLLVNHQKHYQFNEEALQQAVSKSVSYLSNKYVTDVCSILFAKAIWTALTKDSYHLPENILFAVKKKIKFNVILNLSRDIAFFVLNCSVGFTVLKLLCHHCRIYNHDIVSFFIPVVKVLHTPLFFKIISDSHQ